MKKKLVSILKQLDNYDVYGKRDVEVIGISDDSRKVSDGDLFIAIKGQNYDGHKYITKAIKKGAKVVVGEISPKKDWTKNITYVKTKNSRKALGLIASSWYGNPSKKLEVIGVTGTDGKTTTATIIYHLLKSARKNVGLISTVKVIVGEK